MSHERSSRKAFSGRLITVRVDEFSHHGRPVWREVIEHPGSVAVIALTADEKVILADVWRHAQQTSFLEIPAGVIESGEDALRTASRELLEETGYVAGTYDHLMTLAPTPGYSEEQISLYLATGCVRVSNSDAEPDIRSISLLDLSEVRELIGSGHDRVFDGKTAVGLLWLVQHWDEVITGQDFRASQT